MSKGRDKVGRSFKFTKRQKPIVAQIWGTKPDDFYNTAKYCRELGFDGIDLNMGCPIDSVVKKGACSALINNHKLASEIIEATKNGGGLPVSVKTRLGFDNIIIHEWIGFLLEQDISALTIHLRTVEEQSRVDAHWEVAPEIVKLRNKLSPQTVLIGNGDIKSYLEIKEKYKAYGLEGFMAGRGIFTNPWIFNKNIDLDKITAKDRLKLYLKHINLFLETWQKDKNPDSLKRFSKMWVNNFPDAGILRDKVNQSKNISDMITLIENYISS
jgi:tRNA-dihydrouridine synthase